MYSRVCLLDRSISPVGVGGCCWSRVDIMITTAAMFLIQLRHAREFVMQSSGGFVDECVK